ncbi:cytochrome b [Thermaurantiacus sp.]
MHTGARPSRGYSTLSLSLHWLIALLILGNLTSGFLASDLLRSTVAEERERGLQLIELHKSFGLTILLLSVLRLAVRLGEGFPPLPAHMTLTERLLARATHWGFYALLLAIPLAGWVLISASPDGSTFWFGLFPWPHLPTGTDAGLARAASEAHEALAIGAVVLLLLHIAGALKHQLLDRDDVLARMLPFLSRT